MQGTFAPFWHVLRTSSEKLANLHLQMVQKVTELVKEVTRYAEELHKKHKTVCSYAVQHILCIVVVSCYSNWDISVISMVSEGDETLIVAVFRGVVWCVSVDVYQHFGGTSCFLLHGGRLPFSCL